MSPRVAALALVASAGAAGVLVVRSVRGQDPPVSGGPLEPAPQHSETAASPQALALRLHPGQDLRRELTALAEREGLEAAAVVTCVGSLTRVALRYADRSEPTTLEGKFEIVSLVGTLSRHGAHLHLSVSDGEGRTLGGHLLDGSTVYTTAEIVLTVLPGLRFTRAPDPQTGFKELVVEAAPSPAEPR